MYFDYDSDDSDDIWLQLYCQYFDYDSNDDIWFLPYLWYFDYG